MNQPSSARADPGEAFAIRSATTRDVPAIRELIPRSVRALSAAYYSAAQIEAALERIFGVDTLLVDDGTYLVAEAGGEIVGAGGWSRRRTLFGGDQHKGGVPDAELDPRADAARIRAFYVDPAWARRGIGRALLALCEDAARSAGFSRLELLATLPGVPLYAALGYAEIRPVAEPLGVGLTLPGVIMGKAI